MSVLTRICKTEIAGETLILHPEKVAFWEEKGTLLLSDLHLGKVSHFRKNGIAIPGKAQERNFIRLDKMIARFQPSRVLFLGDLFHSYRNGEVERMGELRNKWKAVKMELVLGNHDIMPLSVYDEIGINVQPEELIEGPFQFTHDPDVECKPDHFQVSGHLHPGVKLRGKGRQSEVIACFWFGQEQGLLPAFGQLTGKYVIRPKMGDKVFGIAGNEIIEFG